MELTIASKLFRGSMTKDEAGQQRQEAINLTNADLNTTYTIKGINAREAGMKEFLFTLGCFEGEQVTVISGLAENFVINIKDARYSIDEELARAILI